MVVYVMRHCEAEDGAQMDPTRELTKTGKRQAKAMGKWLTRQAHKPDIVIQSSMKRSHQTAKRVAKQLDVDRISTPFIDPEGTPEKAWATIKQIASAQGAKNVLAVTHGPLVEKLLAYLIGGTHETLHFAHGAIAHIHSDEQIQEAAGEYTYDEAEMKRWLLGDGGNSGNCDVCEDNADMGWIDMDDVFEGVFEDIDDAPAHPNCDCTVEFKTRRFRVYASHREPLEGIALREATKPPAGAKLHWMVTPHVIARDEDEQDALGVAEAALELVLASGI